MLGGGNHGITKQLIIIFHKICRHFIDFCSWYIKYHWCYSNTCFKMTKSSRITYKTPLWCGRPDLYSVFLRQSWTSISAVPANTNSSSRASNTPIRRASSTCNIKYHWCLQSPFSVQLIGRWVLNDVQNMVLNMAWQIKTGLFQN